MGRKEENSIALEACRPVRVFAVASSLKTSGRWVLAIPSGLTFYSVFWAGLSTLCSDKQIKKLKLEEH
jgi:hypothetical protein